MSKAIVAAAAVVGAIALTQWLQGAGFSQDALALVWIVCAVIVALDFIGPSRLRSLGRAAPMLSTALVFLLAGAAGVWGWKIFVRREHANVPTVSAAPPTSTTTTSVPQEVSRPHVFMVSGGFQPQPRVVSMPPKPQQQQQFKAAITLRTTGPSIAPGAKTHIFIIQEDLDPTKKPIVDKANDNANEVPSGQPFTVLGPAHGVGLGRAFVVLFLDYRSSLNPEPIYKQAWYLLFQGASKIEPVPGQKDKSIRFIPLPFVEASTNQKQKIVAYLMEVLKFDASAY